MSEFNFTQDEVPTSEGVFDVSFDVVYEIVRDESGEECWWEVDGEISLSGWDEYGNPMNLTIKNDQPLFGEVVKYVDDDVVEQCKEDHGGW
jgi:hypothetical protein